MSQSDERVRQAKERIEKSLQEAREDIQRYASDPEKQELVRQLQRFLIDHQIIFSAAKAAGEVMGKYGVRAEIAQNMLNEGFDIDIISRMTGIPSDDVWQLR